MTHELQLTATAPFQAPAPCAHQARNKRLCIHRNCLLVISGNSKLIFEIFETVFLSYKQHSTLSAFGPTTSLFALYFVQLDKKTETQYYQPLSFISKIKLLRTIQT